MDNRHSQAVPQDITEQAKNLLIEVKKLLEPYCTTLTVKQRQTLTKMSAKTLSFGTNALQHGINHPEFLPGHISLEEWKIDMADVTNLKPIDVILKDLAQLASDTCMVAGIEASNAARAYYNNVKRAASDGIAGAQPIYDDLKPTFRSKATRTKKQADE